MPSCLANPDSTTKKLSAVGAKLLQLDVSRKRKAQEIPPVGRRFVMACTKTYALQGLKLPLRLCSNKRCSDLPWLAFGAMPSRLDSAMQTQLASADNTDGDAAMNSLSSFTSNMSVNR